MSDGVLSVHHGSGNTRAECNSLLHDVPLGNRAHYNGKVPWGVPPMTTPINGGTGRTCQRYHTNAKVVVYATLSGMISFLPSGAIHGCNHHFSLMCFGYTQEELLKKVKVVWVFANRWPASDSMRMCVLVLSVCSTETNNVRHTLQQRLLDGSV